MATAAPTEWADAAVCGGIYGDFYIEGKCTKKFYYEIFWRGAKIWSKGSFFHFSILYFYVIVNTERNITVKLSLSQCN